MEHLTIKLNSNSNRLRLKFHWKPKIFYVVSSLSISPTQIKVPLCFEKSLIFTQKNKQNGVDRFHLRDVCSCAITTIRYTTSTEIHLKRFL